jgi:hypothetical protein
VYREAGALPKKAFASLVEEARKLDMEKVREEIAKHDETHGA